MTADSVGEAETSTSKIQDPAVIDRRYNLAKA
jgi:hypothetical protein